MHLFHIPQCIILWHKFVWCIVGFVTPVYGCRLYGIWIDDNIEDICHFWTEQPVWLTVSTVSKTMRYPMEFTTKVNCTINICKKTISYTLSREYRVMRNRYSWLLFTSEDRLCANLRVQEQLTNMTSQYQCLAFAWRYRSTVMTSQC